MLRGRGLHGANPSLGQLLEQGRIAGETFMLVDNAMVGDAPVLPDEEPAGPDKRRAAHASARDNALELDPALAVVAGGVRPS